MARSTCVIRSSRLLARVISCSRSNVLVPVSAWSSPAESVSRSRCSSVISLSVWSYSACSSSRRSVSATRIFSVSAALRVRFVGGLGGRGGPGLGCLGHRRSLGRAPRRGDQRSSRPGGRPRRAMPAGLAVGAGRVPFRARPSHSGFPPSVSRNRPRPGTLGGPWRRHPAAAVRSSPTCTNGAAERTPRTPEGGKDTERDTDSDNTGRTGSCQVNGHESARTSGSDTRPSPD